MSEDEFNRAFTMIHSVYLSGNEELDEKGVEKVRNATRGLIATNLPGTYSATYSGKSGADVTVSGIKFKHGFHDQECLVLEGSLVRKEDGSGFTAMPDRQTILNNLVTNGILSAHNDGHHYVLTSDIPVKSASRALNFSHGTNVDAKAEIKWFSKQFSWSSPLGTPPKQTICIEDWLGDDESMKKGITLSNFSKIKQKTARISTMTNQASSAGVDLTEAEGEEVEKLSKEISKLKTTQI
jgi:hypothetical protein